MSLAVVFVFKQKSAYEMRIGDWSSDVCSSDLALPKSPSLASTLNCTRSRSPCHAVAAYSAWVSPGSNTGSPKSSGRMRPWVPRNDAAPAHCGAQRHCAPSEPTSPSATRSEEHTSELQSLMRISYAVFCLNKK